MMELLVTFLTSRPGHQHEGRAEGQGIHWHTNLGNCLLIVTWQTLCDDAVMAGTAYSSFIDTLWCVAHLSHMACTAFSSHITGFVWFADYFSHMAGTFYSITWKVLLNTQVMWQTLSTLVTSHASPTQLRDRHCFLKSHSRHFLLK